MKILIISGSRNPSGQTASAQQALAQGIKRAGGECEQVFLPSLNISHCRQCDDKGWGTCRSEGRCIVEDDLPGLANKVREADAVVFATPVYYSDLSESLKAFTDRLRRICTFESAREGIAGKPAIGVCVAGGGGGGAVKCCGSLEWALATCGFEVVDMVPARRQNLEAKLPVFEITGEWFARLAAG